MIRGFLQLGFNAGLKMFFRRADTAGAENVPATGPVIFILNHPNALVDPVVLLCKAGRPVSFLAKEPLFRTPVIGQLVKAMNSIPVYRRMDQADTSNNQQTFAAARDLLAKGGSLALFPEGTSHSDPRLKPFRTGAARIALGANLPGLVVVPAGLFYTAKSRFRSSVLLCFGPPVPVEPVLPGPDGEPAAEPVRTLTSRLEKALGDLTLQSDQHEALKLAETAERLLSSVAPERPDLAGRLELRQRLLRGYARLRDEAPDRLARLAARLARYGAALSEASLTPELLPIAGYRAWTVTLAALKALLTLFVLLPLALLGMVLHFPAWLATHLVSARLGRDDPDVIATVKALGGLLLYPLTWIILAWAAWRIRGGRAAAAALVIAPLAAWAALRFIEQFDRLAGGTRGVLLAVTGRRRFLRLVAERNALVEEFVAVGEEYGI